MNTESNTVPALPVESTVTDRRYSTRPFYWSVRRELWENRSIYIAPLIVAAVQVFGFGISIIGLAERRRAVLLLEPAKQRAAIEQPYDLAAMMMIFTVVHRRRVLLSRRAARRTARSQHPVLEVAAGFGSHHRAFEGSSFRWRFCR